MPRWCATAAIVDAASEGETVGVVVNQTPFYGESGGQMGDTGTISGEGFRIEVTDTQKKGDGLFVHEGKVVKGTVKTGAAVELDGRSRAPHAAALQPLGHASGARGAARSARHPCRAKGLAGRAGAAALRLLASQADLGRGTREGREDGQRDRGAEQPGDHPADVGRRRDRRGRDGAVRREIWRRGARRLDGHGDRRRQVRQALFGRAVRRHACQRHRRHRPRPAGRRKRGRGRRAPHRGADRRGGAPPSRRAGQAAEGGRSDAQGRGGRRAGAGRGAARRTPQARTRADRGEARSWRSAAARRPVAAARPKRLPAPASSAAR